ncbi:PREDICTED: tetratricopeptide repeat protein 1 [Ceratosolen solmsi marchali]|uniref:Tetratricopeptide repeat protein 1 n=1 Tax=Ceratosolen solmsi marchali TaxID=326594 RepID=A0AAJ6YP42_9HYME|nr:PREDICTED: tetratricopeptide repeat protein 1 [Ceratosolen solmsi marchali]
MDYNQGDKGKIPSNKEIIDELTKDLEKSAKLEAQDEKSSLDVCPGNDESNKSNEEYKSNTKSDDNANEQEKDEYFINEIALKDRDLTLSEDEKQRLKSDADNYKNKGNNFFRDGDYVSAASSYTEGLLTCPLQFTKDRAILFANRAASKAKFIADKNSAITDCTEAIKLDSDYVKAYMRRAQLYKEINKLDEALADYKQILTFDPMHKESIFAIKTLETMINERNEKLKDEMIDKLKDLGNMVLRPFGLSTNNFQMQKDESSGSYSVKFVNNST